MSQRKDHHDDVYAQRDRPEPRNLRHTRSRFFRRFNSRHILAQFQQPVKPLHARLGRHLR